jgi:hypothetical protein
VLARQHREAGAARSALGILAADRGGRELRTVWAEEPLFASRSPMEPAWHLAPEDRLQVLPSSGLSGTPALLAQSRDPAMPGSHRLAVLLCDLEGAGLHVAWSAERALSGPGGTVWFIDAADRYTIVGDFAPSRGCPVLVQGPETSSAAGPSIAVMSVDMTARAFRLTLVLSGLVPPLRGGAPGWQINSQDRLHVIGRPERDSACKILVQRRARDRTERHLLGVLSMDASGLWTEWVAGETLPARRIASKGWRPDPLDRFYVLPGCKLLVQSRALADPDKSRLGVLSLEGTAPGLVTEQVFEHALRSPA